VRHRHADLDVQVVWCVDADSPIKQIALTLTNRGARTQQLRVIGMAEWVMGAERGDRRTNDTACFTQRLPAAANHASATRRLTSLSCTQRDRSGGFGQATGFWRLSATRTAGPDWTCDRRECFGRAWPPGRPGPVSTSAPAPGWTPARRWPRG